MSDPTHSITTAQHSLSSEQAGRTRRYLISMGIRTVCVIGAIFIPGWPRWVLIAGAVVLQAAARAGDAAGRLARALFSRPPSAAVSEDVQVDVMDVQETPSSPFPPSAAPDRAGEAQQGTSPA